MNRPLLRKTGAVLLLGFGAAVLFGAAGALAQAAPGGGAAPPPTVGSGEELPNVFDFILANFKDLGSTWRERIEGPSLVLFSTLLTVQGISIGAQLALAHYHARFDRAAGLMSRGVKFLVFGAAAFYLIDHVGWWLPAIYDTFLEAAAVVSGEPIDAFQSPSDIMQVDYAVNAKMMEVSADVGWWEYLTGGTGKMVGMALMAGLSKLGLRLAFTGMVVQVGITQLSYFVVAGLAPFFLAFVAFPRTAGLAEGYLKLLLYVCVKLFILLVLLNYMVELPQFIIEQYDFQAMSDQEKTNALLHASGSILAGAATSVLAVWAIPMTFARMVTRRVDFDLEELARW